MKNIAFVTVALFGCAVSVEPPPLEPEPDTIEVVLFGGWIHSQDGLQPLEGSALGWIDSGPCRLTVELDVDHAREGEGQWSVSIFDGQFRSGFAVPATPGRHILEIDGGLSEYCSTAIAAPADPAYGDRLVRVTAGTEGGGT